MRTNTCALAGRAWEPDHGGHGGLPETAGGVGLRLPTAARQRRRGRRLVSFFIAVVRPHVSNIRRGHGWKICFSYCRKLHCVFIFCGVNYNKQGGTFSSVCRWEFRCTTFVCASVCVCLFVCYFVCRLGFSQQRFFRSVCVFMLRDALSPDCT